MSTMPAGTPSVLVVCTGNICRSPAVERVLAGALEGVVNVSSAGTSAVVGSGVSAPMIPLIEAAGGDTSGFEARQVTAGMLREANLVLALTREHRSALVRLAPAALRKTFTLRELARLLSLANLEGLPDEPVARVEELLSRAKLARTHAAARLTDSTAADDDVVDPIGGNAELYAQAWSQLAPATHAIAAALAPAEARTA